MPSRIAIGIVTGILSGVWASLSLTLGMITFAGFLGWSTFFAAGGGSKGLKTALITNLSGVVWGYIMMQLSNLFSLPFGETIGLGAAVVIGACGMCLQSYWKWLSFIPGTFIGSSTFFATGFNFSGSVAAMIAGVLFGYISELGVSILTRRSTHE